MTKVQAKVEERSLALVEEANSVEVVDQDSLTVATDVLSTIKGLRKEVASTFDPIISKAHKTHQEAIAQKKKVDAPLMAAEKALKGGIAGFIDEQDRKRREEEARVEDERQAALAIMEAKKKESEDIATAMADAGLGDLVFEEPIQAPEPIIQEYIPEPKMEGAHTQTRWHAEVVDKDELIKAVSSGKVSTEALNPSMPYLNSRATADKDTFNIPGAKAVKETSVVSKGN